MRILLVMNLLPILVPLALVPIIVAVILLSKRARDQRTDAMRSAASTVGFAFEEKGDIEALVAKGALPLFGRGHTKRVTNVMTGRFDDREVMVFDYRYTTGGGKESHTWRQTVALFPRGGRRLPSFALSPENVLHKIGQAFGYQDIDFESHPGFSKRYLLRGTDESAIRAAFSPAVLSYFEERPGWSVEVETQTVGIFRAGKRCAPEEVAAFLDDARAMLHVLAP